MTELATLVTNRPLKFATPLESVAVWAVVVAFKFPPLVSVAVIAVAYEATVLPYVSSTVTCGCWAKVIPAVAMDEGCCNTNSLEAVVGLTAMPPDVAGTKPPEVKVSVTVAALVTNNPLKLATPLDGVAVGAVVVAFKFPPLVSAAVIAVA